MHQILNPSLNLNQKGLNSVSIDEIKTLFSSTNPIEDDDNAIEYNFKLTDKISITFFEEFLKNLPFEVSVIFLENGEIYLGTSFSKNRGTSVGSYEDKGVDMNKSVIEMHNHPSGSANPSIMDIMKGLPNKTYSIVNSQGITFFSIEKLFGVMDDFFELCVEKGYHVNDEMDIFKFYEWLAGLDSDLEKEYTKVFLDKMCIDGKMKMETIPWSNNQSIIDKFKDKNINI